MLRSLTLSLLERRRERRNRVKQLRWQQRSLPDCVVPNLSLAEKEVRNRLGPACLLAAADAQACPAPGLRTFPGLSHACRAACAQWFQKYDQLLSGYMRTVGLDLTLVRPLPDMPKAALSCALCASCRYPAGRCVYEDHA